MAVRIGDGHIGGVISVANQMKISEKHFFLFKHMLKRSCMLSRMKILSGVCGDKELAVV